MSELTDEEVLALCNRQEVSEHRNEKRIRAVLKGCCPWLSRTNTVALARDIVAEMQRIEVEEAEAADDYIAATSGREDGQDFDRDAP